METVDGVNTAPTWLNQGFSLTNSHPVDIPYIPDSATIGGTTIASHWPGTVTAGKITWDTTNALANNFNNVFGHPASLVAATDGQPYHRVHHMSRPTLDDQRTDKSTSHLDGSHPQADADVR